MYKAGIWHMASLTTIANGTIAKALMSSQPSNSYIRAGMVSGENGDRMVVEAPGGTYRGHILNTRNGRNIRAFQGIPYAKPPLGTLRFKDPVKIDKLEGVYEAKDDSRICFQPPIRDRSNVAAFVGGEDCLYLSVYEPQLSKEKDKLLPVLVWIHGGGYQMGSSSWYGPEYLLDRDMILVSINYRLGILGFLSRGDSVLQGNLGMKDQVMALRWVQDNIGSFGGDPGSVTLGGASSGASSVCQHLHSPLSRGLFQRAIAQSGSNESRSFLKSRVEARAGAEKVASYLSCSFQPEDFMECLQNTPLEELFRAALSIRKVKDLSSMDFVPVVEEDSPTAFLTQESITRASDLPLLTGVNSEESIMFYMRLVNGKNKRASDLHRERDLLLPVMAAYDGFPNAKEWTDTALQYYLDSEELNDSNVYKVAHFISDVMFNHGLIKTARKHKGKTYMYKFSYNGQTSLLPFDSRPEQLKDDVNHGDECIYLFDMMENSGMMSPEDLTMSNTILDLWHQFILTGDPTPDTKLWEESERGHKYLDITNKGLIMKTDMFKSRMDFLDQHNLDSVTT